MSDLSWIPGEDQSCQAAIADVRKDSTPTDWMFITYAATSGANSQKLKLGGSGTGGVNELRTHLDDKIIAFAIVRVTDRIDDSVTVKFVWINWLGKGAAAMQKARLSVHMGPVKAFMGQTHQDYSCNTQDELTHEIIMERVMGYSGSGSKVLDSTGKTTLKTQVHGSGGSSVSSNRNQATQQVSWSPEVVETIRDVKGDHSPLSWVIISYERPDSSVLAVVAAGEGDDNNAAQLAEHLRNDNVAYCIIRKTEQIDNSATAKFVYIRWVGNDVPRMQKAKLGTQAGDIYNLFAPCHTSLDTPDLHEVNDANIMKEIMKASGTYQHVLEGHPVSRPPPQSHHQTQQTSHQTAPKPVAQRKPPSDTHGGASKTVEKVIDFQDFDGVKQAIADVRYDGSDTDWVLITYDGPRSNTLKLEGIGSGGLHELKNHLKDNVVMYGLLRTTEKIDDSVTVKFCHIDWRGERIHTMQRAKLATHSGAVRELFHPFHVDINASSDDEITEHLINKKIKAASGTAVHVLN